MRRPIVPPAPLPAKRPEYPPGSLPDSVPCRANDWRRDFVNFMSNDEILNLFQLATLSPSEHLGGQVAIQHLFPDELDAPSNQAAASLGLFERLPLEISFLIFETLDLESVLNFCCVNDRAVELMNNVPYFAALRQHAPDTLRSIYALGVGKWINCKQLYAIMGEESCKNCRKFGPYLFIPSFQRACRNCMHSPAFAMLSASFDHFDFSSVCPVIRVADHADKRAIKWAISADDWLEVDSAQFRDKASSMAEMRIRHNYQTATVSLNVANLGMTPSVVSRFPHIDTVSGNVRLGGWVCKPCLEFKNTVKYYSQSIMMSEWSDTPKEFMTVEDAKAHLNVCFCIKGYINRKIRSHSSKKAWELRRKREAKAQ